MSEPTDSEALAELSEMYQDLIVQLNDEQNKVYYHTITIEKQQKELEELRAFKAETLSRNCEIRYING